MLPGVPNGTHAAAPQDPRLPGSPGMWGRLTEASLSPTFDSWKQTRGKYHPVSHSWGSRPVLDVLPGTATGGVATALAATVPSRTSHPDLSLPLLFSPGAAHKSPRGGFIAQRDCCSWVLLPCLLTHILPKWSGLKRGVSVNEVLGKENASVPNPTRILPPSPLQNQANFA